MQGGGLLSKRHIGACFFLLRTESEQIYVEALALLEKAALELRVMVSPV